MAQADGGYPFLVPDPPRTAEGYRAMDERRATKTLLTL
jgi:hypothetical protein